MSTSSTIPINLAIRAVRLHIAMCEAATPGPWDAWLPVVVTAETSRFILAARAGYKATLEYIGNRLENNYSHDLKLTKRHTYADIMELYAAVRPLVEHLDQTRPNWRTE